MLPKSHFGMCLSARCIDFARALDLPLSFLWQGFDWNAAKRERRSVEVEWARISRVSISLAYSSICILRSQVLIRYGLPGVVRRHTLIPDGREFWH